MSGSSPQRLRELIVKLGHEPLAEIPDVAEALESEALEILVALEEQLEALEAQARGDLATIDSQQGEIAQLQEQLERAEKFIAKQGMEYRFAEFCGGVHNPAKERE